MKKELDQKKVIFGTILFVLIVLVSFNIDQFTGSATKSSQSGVETLTKLYVSSFPNLISEYNPTIDGGKKVFFTIEVGSQGSKDEVSIYDSNSRTGHRIATVKLTEGCGGSSCRPFRITSANYVTATTWNGEYCARVYDRGLKKEIESCFMVK